MRPYCRRPLKLFVLLFCWCGFFGFEDFIITLHYSALADFAKTDFTQIKTHSIRFNAIIPYSYLRLDSHRVHLWQLLKLFFSFCSFSAYYLRWPCSTESDASVGLNVFWDFIHGPRLWAPFGGGGKAQLVYTFGHICNRNSFATANIVGNFFVTSGFLQIFGGLLLLASLVALCVFVVVVNCVCVFVCAWFQYECLP